jgi:hypothetical protein
MSNKKFYTIYTAGSFLTSDPIETLRDLERLMLENLENYSIDDLTIYELKQVDFKINQQLVLEK